MTLLEFALKWIDILMEALLPLNDNSLSKSTQM